MTRAALAVLFAVSACGQREPAQRHPGAVAAARRCAHVFETLDDIEPDDRQRAIANACADVVVEKACHDEFAAFDTPPDQRIAKLLEVCTRAYCPILPAPKPARCTDPDGGVPEFWHAVHLFDLGAEATAILDATQPARLPEPPPPHDLPRLPSEAVTWRIPIITITKDTITLAWRPPDGGPDVVVLAQPAVEFDCGKLREQLALEVMKTWRDTVRPTRSKQLLLSTTPAAPDRATFAVMDCANDRSGPRQLYPDVTLSVQR
jgi:hypothetical protein